MQAATDKRKHSLRKASFLKILKDDFTNKLPLPPAFTDIFEEEIPPWFILESAGTRKCWRVDTEQGEDGDLYLGYGFECFVKAHSLRTGNFLLFEQENPPILEVKIYEKDGSERTTEATFESEYEVGGASESPTETPIIHQEGNASPCPAIHTVTPVQFRASKKQRGVIGNDESERKRCILSVSEHGVCFSVTWRMARHFLYYLTIPRAMLSGKRFFNNDIITVKDGKGNSWEMELRRRQDGRVDFARGWREFVNDNDLSDGDTLTFEFVSNNVMQVHVQRASQVNNHSQREQDGEIPQPEHKNSTREDEELVDVCTPISNVPLNMGDSERLASAFKSSFSFTWRHKTRHSHLHVPKSIANKHKLENTDMLILCDPEGKHWPMEVRTRQSDGRVGIGRGWSEFTKAYGFGAGDTLIFEFITDRFVRVSVVKAGERHHRISGAIIKQEVFRLD